MKGLLPALWVARPSRHPACWVVWPPTGNLSKWGIPTGMGWRTWSDRIRTTEAVDVWLMNGLAITTMGSPEAASTDWEIQ